jgi:hypothetical protein
MNEPEWSDTEILRAIGTQLRQLNEQVSTIKNIIGFVVVLWLIGAVAVVAMSQN